MADIRFIINKKNSQVLYRMVIMASAEVQEHAIPRTEAA